MSRLHLAPSAAWLALLQICFYFPKIVPFLTVGFLLFSLNCHDVRFAPRSVPLLNYLASSPDYFLQFFQNWLFVRSNDSAVAPSWSSNLIPFSQFHSLHFRQWAIAHRMFCISCRVADVIPKTASNFSIFFVPSNKGAATYRSAPRPRF